MAIWKASGPDGRNLLIEAPAGDEAAVRDYVAGKGDNRDERWLNHDEALVSEHRGEAGKIRTLYELPRDVQPAEGGAKKPSS